jgi:hypothetical protein
MRPLLLLFSMLLTACGSTSGGDAGCVDTSKSPPDLISNYSFECGGSAPTEWTAVYGTLSFPAGHTGRAAQLTVDSAGGRLAYNPTLAAGGGSNTFCVTAWVSGTAPYMKLRVLKQSGPGNFTEYDFNAPSGGSIWSRIPPTTALAIPFDNAQGLQLLFEAQQGRADGMNAKVGDTLLIDDVDLWQSTSGKCDEAR